ncbi:MAG: DnaJ domain-containing protein [Candidatus Woesearchaeota archaeon]
MVQMIRQEQIGDIRFGIPDDMEELHKPWSFYDVLGVSRTASKDEIKRAFISLAQKYHLI